MLLNHIILAMLWIIYCALHSLLASEWLKKKLRQQMKTYKWYRLWYTLFAFLFLVVVLYYQIIIPAHKLFSINGFILMAGSVLCFSGLVMMAICIRKYFMNLSGLRSLFIENFSNELQITGIHRYIRHPLYLGTFGFIWGLFLLLPYLSLLISNIIITVYTLIGITLEERKLINEFGDKYLKYQATVPKLIPFLKPKRQL
jgi:protein-S-isoprenylcysteine O-methyltransferase Ste14